MRPFVHPIIAVSWGEPPRLAFEPKPHWELGQTLDLFDLPTGAALGFFALWLWPDRVPSPVTKFRLAQDPNISAKGAGEKARNAKAWHRAIAAAETTNAKVFRSLHLGHLAAAHAVRGRKARPWLTIRGRAQRCPRQSRPPPEDDPAERAAAETARARRARSSSAIRR